jgi:hypothetical protein
VVDLDEVGVEERSSPVPDWGGNLYCVETL